MMKGVGHDPFNLKLAKIAIEEGILIKQWRLHNGEFKVAIMTALFEVLSTNRLFKNYKMLFKI